MNKDARFSNNKATDLLAIAELMLEGEIRYRAGKLKEAITALEGEVAREDKLRYSEPVGSTISQRASATTCSGRNLVGCVAARSSSRSRRVRRHAWKLASCTPRRRQKARTDSLDFCQASTVSRQNCSRPESRRRCLT